MKSSKSKLFFFFNFLQLAKYPKIQIKNTKKKKNSQTKNIFCIRYNRPIQQFYDPNYHRQQMNQSQNSIALMDQSITSIDYNQTPIVPSGWNSVGPASLQDHSFYMNNENSYYQSRCIYQSLTNQSRNQNSKILPLIGMRNF